MSINIYRFKISLIEYHAVPANKLHRILDIAGNATFEDLHDLIFTAFDRYDPHLYQFILTREEAKSDHALYSCKEQVLDPHSMEDADMMMDEGDIAHNAATSPSTTRSCKKKTSSTTASTSATTGCTACAWKKSIRWKRQPLATNPMPSS